MLPGWSPDTTIGAKGSSLPSMVMPRGPLVLGNSTVKTIDVCGSGSSENVIKIFNLYKNRFFLNSTNQQSFRLFVFSV